MTMRRRSGLWISFTEGPDSDSAERAIQDNGTFTAVISSAAKPRAAELAVVSMTGESADYLGISRAGIRVVTGKRRVSVSHLVDLGQVPINDLLAALPKRFQTHGLSTEGANRVSPRLWEELLAGISKLCPAVGPELPKLRKLISEVEDGRMRRHGGLEVFERDAIASAIETFGGTKLSKQVLRSADPADSSQVPASFLQRLKQVSLREDTQIVHDAATFPGLEVAQRYIVGAVELTNMHGERLTILNCNRQPLEQTLGVDLIYYAHAYDSFVLVQYKRMTHQADRGPAYRPSRDHNYERELARMCEVENWLAANASEHTARLADSRLSSQPLFFKLCESKARAALDEGMVSGMYVPLPLWQQFMQSSEARGKRGGIAVGWNNAPRHFSNGDFTKLLRRGWIGSSGRQSELLSRIVEEVLASHHMLVFAATSAALGSRDYLRDPFGRFAEEDDPLAAR